MRKISAIVITFNEEKNLSRCLASIKDVVDEIIVVDSSSEDKTIKIAQSYGAKVIQNKFEGYAKQKIFATEKTTHNWVLSLDADEELSPELKESIIDLKNVVKHDVYKMPRLTNYCGKWIKHCGWYPDYQTRLYDRTKGTWEDIKVHEYWRTDDKKATIGILQGDLLHYSFDSIESHKKKIEKYTELAAQAAVDAGKKAGILKVIFSPIWHFISEYFFKRGFLDGHYGYVICKLSAYSAYLKYSKIRRYSKNPKQ